MSFAVIASSAYLAFCCATSLFSMATSTITISHNGERILRIDHSHDDPFEINFFGTIMEREQIKVVILGACIDAAGNFVIKKMVGTRTMPDSLLKNFMTKIREVVEQQGQGPLTFACVMIGRLTAPNEEIHLMENSSTPFRRDMQADPNFDSVSIRFPTLVVSTFKDPPDVQMTMVTF